MNDDDPLTIGRFARLTGLSVDTLRHYDQVSLLLPASVDPASGYRRYGREQARRASQIRTLIVTRHRQQSSSQGDRKSENNQGQAAHPNGSEGL